MERHLFLAIFSRGGRGEGGGLCEVQEASKYNGRNGNINVMGLSNIYGHLAQLLQLTHSSW